jgi:hypothetical protein
MKFLSKKDDRNPEWTDYWQLELDIDVEYPRVRYRYVIFDKHDNAFHDDSRCDFKYTADIDVDQCKRNFKKEIASFQCDAQGVAIKKDVFPLINR